MNEITSITGLGLDEGKKIITFLMIIVYSGIIYFIGYLLFKFLRVMSEHRIISIIVTVAMATSMYMAGNPFVFDYKKINFDNSKKLFQTEVKNSTINGIAVKYNIDYSKLKEVLDKQKIGYENIVEIEKIANTIKQTQ